MAGLPSPPSDFRSSFRPSRIAGILWGLFSLTAFISAFLLPAHIYLTMAGWKIKLTPWYFKLYFGILFFSALYHGLYRLKTILKDLKIL